MFRWLVVLMIVVPAAEIYVLLTMGKLIGGWQTFGSIVLMGFLGAYLAKSEGRKVWEYAQFQLSAGEIPTDSILDGICIFAGGLLMMLPGFLTDIVGLLLVLPFTRPTAKALIARCIRKYIDQGSFTMFRRR